MTTRVPQRAYGGVSADERIAARRAKLLDAGLELFGTRGFAATGVKDVCREAGLTDRYFYESFNDSEALFLAVFDRLTDELFRAVAEAVVESGGDAERQLRRAIGTFVGALAADPRKPRVLFAEAAAAGPGRRRAHARDAAPLRRARRGHRAPARAGRHAPTRTCSSRAVAGRPARARGHRPRGRRARHPASTAWSTAASRSTCGC